MRKQIITSTIGLILVLCMVANAGQEDIRHMREIEQMRMQVEKLRLEAMEHELRARQLRTEAARLDLHVRTEMMHAQMRKEQQRDIEMMERRIAELREASERAEKEGRIDRSRRLWDESEHLAEELERRIEGRQREEHMGRMHARIKELVGALEEAERQGRERQADELREEIGGLKREIKEQERNMKAEHLEREIHHLLAAAEEAEEQDKGDKADAMRREAEQLERHLHELFEEDSDDQDDDDDDEDEEEVSIEEVPRIVKTIILKHAKGGDIKEIERENQDGVKVYEVEIIAGDEEIELKVARNGKIISRKVESRWDDDDEDDDEDEDYDDDDDEDSDELWEKIESLHRQLAELNEAVEHLRNRLK